MHDIEQYLEASENKIKELLDKKAPEQYPFSRSFEIETFTDNQNFRKESNPKEDDLDEYKGQLLIQGEPGGGKTISLIKLADKLIGKTKGIQPNSVNFVLPIFAEIYTWYTWKYIDENQQQKEQETRDTIFKWLLEKTKLYQQILEAKINARKVLLLLDGLDELPFNVPEDQNNPNSSLQDYRVKFIEALNQFLENTNYEITVIMTCRSRDYQEIVKNHPENEFKCTEKLLLRRLDIKEIEKYLKEKEIIEDETKREKLLNIIRINPAISKIIRTPFILKTLLDVYNDFDGEENTESQNLRAISNIEQLFDKYIEQGYYRETEKLKSTKKVDFPYTLKELKNKLGGIAVVMMGDDEPDNNDILLRMFKPVIPEEKKQYNLIEFAINIQLIFEKHPEKKIYGFRHNLIRDYLTFQYSQEFLRPSQNSTEENSITKKQVVRALGKIDNNPKAVELLADLLLSQEEDKDIRYEAANSIGQFISPGSFEGYDKTFDPDCIQNYSIDKFDKDDIKDYFQKFAPEKLINDVEDIDKIEQCSCGIPLVVNLIALQLRDGVPLKEITQPGGISSQEIIGKTCERFLIHVREKEKNPLDNKDLRIIYLLTIMRRYDQDFLQEMIGEELNLLALGPQLNSKYSFISSELILEDNYKFYFKKYLLTRNNDYEILKELCKNARNYCEEWFLSKNGFELSSLNKSAEKWIDNQDYREIIFDWIYYWFWRDEEEGWYYGIPYLVQGWNYDPSWAHSILDMIDSGKQFISTRKSQDQLRLFRWGIETSKQDISSRDDRSKLLDKLEERANKTTNEEEWVSIVYLKRGDLLFEQKKYEEAQAQYEQAKKYVPPGIDSLRKRLKELLQKVERRIEAKEEKEELERQIQEKKELERQIQEKKELERQTQEKEELERQIQEKEELERQIQEKKDIQVEPTETPGSSSQEVKNQESPKEGKLSFTESVIAAIAFLIGGLFGENQVGLFGIILTSILIFIFRFTVQNTTPQQQRESWEGILKLFSELYEKIRMKINN